MPFQREDITIEQRMQMVTSMLSQPGRYGLVSQLAGEHQLSRQSLYTMVERGRDGLAASLRAGSPGRPAPAVLLEVDQNRLDRAILTLTVVGHASLEGVQLCLEELFGLRRSTGAISGVVDAAGERARAWREGVCPPAPIRADLDEIFAGSTPHLAIVDHDSLLLLTLEAASSRDSTAWGVTLLDQAARGVVLAEAASDGALGIVSGLRESGVTPVQLSDLFHVVRALVIVRGQLEKAAYAAVAREERARLAEAEAEAVQRRRGRPRQTERSVAAAVTASQTAIQRADDYAWLVGVVRTTLEPVDAPTGRLQASSRTRAELAAAAALLAESADARVTKVAGRLARAIDGLVAYQDQLAPAVAPWVRRLGEEPVALIGWGWRHRQGLGLVAPAAMAAAFPREWQEAVSAIWRALDGAHRSSSLAECINSLLRPHLLVHRGADQGLLDLLVCYYNHRVFSRGKRRGRSPLQLAGLPDDGDWLMAIGFAPNRPASRPALVATQAQPQTQSVNRLAA